MVLRVRAPMDWPFRMRAHVVVAGCIALLRATHSRGYSFVRRRYKSWKAVEYGVAPPLRHAHFLTYLGDTGRSAHTHATRFETHLFHFISARRRAAARHVRRSFPAAVQRRYAAKQSTETATAQGLSSGYLPTYVLNHRSIASRPRCGRQEPRRVLPACA